MKTFVTGGTGCIGSHLVDRLIEDESVEEVRCLVRGSEKWLSGKPYSRISGDLFNQRSIEEGLQDIDTLYHVAAIVKSPHRHEFERINVEAAVNLIRTAVKSGVKKIILLSSLAAAGPSAGRPLTEDAPLRPVSMYGESKKRMEEMAGAIDAPGVSISIIRPPAVYGPRETQIYSWFKMANNRFCPIVGDGKKPQLSLVYVSDLIDGIRLAAGRNTPGIHTYFITGPDIVNWEQIKNTSSRVLGKKPLSLYIPSGWVKRIAGLVESTASMLGSYPDLNREKANEIILEWTCSSEKAAKELHYNPKVTLDEGISRTIHWYKKHDWL